MHNNPAAIGLRIAMFFPAALVLAIIQPFETDALPFVVRLVYWATLTTVLAALGGFAVSAVCKSASHILVSAWQRWLASSVIIALPMMVPVKLIDLALAVWVAPLAGVTVPALPTGSALLDEIGWLYIAVLTITALLLALPALAVGDQGAGQQPMDRTVGDDRHLPGARFFERLPPSLGRELVWVRSEDHYLRVQTRLGQELLLLRMADAMAELEGYPGCRVHRSWWIARDQIAPVTRTGRRMSAILQDGQAVPVSASYRAALEQMS
ncbi:LytTR family DNA-binding domain-containing protein [Altererythrobacter sp. KTW20L]|uniref:LytTR family DNA-binding domain-containing protein n=1 Tax=Altererythrobacter sp. KTW20L TaxID=2942210 RepID=UPI0020C10B82|nr:LytTR family DNA-binding domain-containing protein [Altererythrobacter sp. KTW20L]